MWDSPGDYIYMLVGLLGVLMGLFYLFRALHNLIHGEKIIAEVIDLERDYSAEGVCYVPTFRILSGPNSGFECTVDTGMSKPTYEIGEHVPALYDVGFGNISTKETRVHAYMFTFIGLPIFLSGMVFFCYLMAV